MLMRPVRIERPQLKDEVVALIGLICQGPKEQRIPLAEIVRILGLTLSDEFQQEIAQRGDLVLGETDFSNQGPLISREVRFRGVPVELQMPALLSGGITRFHDSFQLVWARNHSITLSQLVFNVELVHLDISKERVFIDFAGAPDMFVDLG